MILICYDGSEDAQAAIDRAGELFSGESAAVLTVWEPFVQVMARTGASMGFGLDGAQIQEIEKAASAEAERRAEEGATRAREAGLSAEPHVRARESSISDAVLAEAEAIDAKAIVMGTRGLTGLKSLLLGSVSHAVTQRADRPVVVVPSQEVAERRAAAQQ
ncbi:MAG TPA: universal stress protein [Candidatus Dormibacteraeota bacterium]|nr:universal stress protein [Candidatus Dormibacteraeota bacterium]